MLDIPTAKDIGRRNAMHDVSKEDLEAIALRVAHRDAELKEMATRREALVAQIAALQEDLQALDEAARAAREDEELWFYRTLLAPVRKIPTELLSAIFKAAAHGEVVPFAGPRDRVADPAPTSGATAMRIARTCKHWRDVAVQVPGMWNRVSITFRGMGTSGEDEPLLDRMYHAVEAVELRSRPLRVELHLIPLSSDTYHGVISRWRRAVGVFFQRTSAPRIYCTRRSLHGLDDRDMASITDLTYDEAESSFEDVVTRFPLLEKLTLKDQTYNRLFDIDTIPSRILTHLSLALFMNKDITPILKLVPCLQTLRWKSFGFSPRAPMESVTLPTLRKLELQHRDGDIVGALALLAGLHLPMLQHLDIVMSPFATLNDKIARLQNALAAHNLPKLEHLRLALTSEYFLRSMRNAQSYGIAGVRPSYFARLLEGVTAVLQHSAGLLQSHESVPSDQCAALLLNSGLKPGMSRILARNWSSMAFVEDVFDECYADDGTRIVEDRVGICHPGFIIDDMAVLGQVGPLLMDDGILGQRSFALAVDIP